MRPGPDPAGEPKRVAPMNGSFESRLKRKLDTLESLQLRRSPGEIRSGMGVELTRDGRRLLNFSSNDYLGLARHPEVLRAQREAVREYGAGSGGSRLVCGNHPLYRDLEESLAGWKNREASLVFGSGFLTSLGVVPALTGARDGIVYDELSHRCLIEAARLSDAESTSFPHNGVGELARWLDERREEFDAVLVMTEGIFSMDGDRAPLRRLREMTRKQDAWLLVDEAHSAGVWGEDGAGLTPGLETPVEVSMGTLSKAFGNYGGYVAGDAALREFLINRAGSWIYSTGLPPAVVAGNRAALDVIREESRRRRLKQNVSRVAGWLDERDIPRPDPASQVFPLITGDPDQTIRAGELLRERGIFAVPIRYPTVPRKLGRIRISLRSDHQSEHLKRLRAGIRMLEEEDLLLKVDLSYSRP